MNFVLVVATQLLRNFGSHIAKYVFFFNDHHPIFAHFFMVARPAILCGNEKIFILPLKFLKWVEFFFPPNLTKLGYLLGIYLRTNHAKNV